MTELERLQKEINGKVVKWTSPTEWPGLFIDAIILFPPGGEKVTVKPYGYSPEQLSKMLGEHYPVSITGSPTFCFSTIKVKDDTIVYLNRIEQIPPGGEYNAEDISRGHGITGDYPSCPYGG